MFAPRAAARALGRGVGAAWRPNITAAAVAPKCLALARGCASAEGRAAEEGQQAAGSIVYLDEPSQRVRPAAGSGVQFRQFVEDKSGQRFLVRTRRKKRSQVPVRVAPLPLPSGVPEELQEQLRAMASAFLQSERLDMREKEAALRSVAEKTVELHDPDVLNYEEAWEMPPPGEGEDLNEFELLLRLKYARINGQDVTPYVTRLRKLRVLGGQDSEYDEVQEGRMAAEMAGGAGGDRAGAGGEHGVRGAGADEDGGEAYEYTDA